MNTNQTYLVTLRPTGNFYFGSEKHFSFGGKNYLVKSNPFPQQTTLLGMLRYELLRKANLLNGKNKAEEAQLIGPAGFSTTNTKGYGIIHSISPVFLHEARNNRSFIRQGNGWQHGREIRPMATTEKALGSATQAPPILLQGYDAKQPLDDNFIHPTDGTVIPLSHVYLYPAQTGNQKNNKQATDDEALYKQTYCRFARQHKDKKNVEWCFAFYLTTYAELELEQGIMVSMGGDQSAFILNHRKATDELFLPSYTPATDDWVKLTLLSDAFCTENLALTAPAAIALATDFRFIETTAQTTKYYNVSYRNNDSTSADMLRSDKHSLYKAGSVFWLRAADLPVFTKALANPSFTTIGYNYYKIEKYNN